MSTKDRQWHVDNMNTRYTIIVLKGEKLERVEIDVPVEWEKRAQEYASIFFHIELNTVVAFVPLIRIKEVVALLV